MSRFERVALVILVIIAAILWVAVGFRFMQVWQKPLGPQISLPTWTPAPESTTTSRPTAGPTTTSRPTTGPTTTNIPDHQPTLTPFVAARSSQLLCGGPLTMTLLAVGSDTRSPNYLYGLADVIRLVRVDFATPRVTVLEFPRDLWVEIPDISDHYGITHGKLNQAYFYGNPGMGYYDGQGNGPGLLARTLDLNFGARADHYVAVNMQAFTRMIDVIGGIDVYLPRAVDGRKEDQPKRMDLYFPPGPNHLNGQQAIMLARIRQYTVFERADQQNRILCAVRTALLNPKNISQLPQIIDAFDNVVQTDLSPQQISQLACLIPMLDRQNINFASFPVDLLKGTRMYDKDLKKYVFIWEADFNTLRLYINTFNAGIWPSAAPPQVSSSGTPIPAEQTGFTCPK